MSLNSMLTGWFTPARLDRPRSGVHLVGLFVSPEDAELLERQTVIEKGQRNDKERTGIAGLFRISEAEAFVSISTVLQETESLRNASNLEVINQGNKNPDGRCVDTLGGRCIGDPNEVKVDLSLAEQQPLTYEKTGGRSNVNIFISCRVLFGIEEPESLLSTEMPGFAGLLDDENEVKQDNGDVENVLNKKRVYTAADGVGLNGKEWAWGGEGVNVENVFEEEREGRKFQSEVGRVGFNGCCFRFCLAFWWLPLLYVSRSLLFLSPNRYPPKKKNTLSFAKKKKYEPSHRKETEESQLVGITGRPPASHDGAGGPTVGVGSSWGGLDWIFWALAGKGNMVHSQFPLDLSPRLTGFCQLLVHLFAAGFGKYPLPNQDTDTDRYGDSSAPITCRAFSRTRRGTKLGTCPCTPFPLRGYVRLPCQLDTDSSPTTSTVYCVEYYRHAILNSMVKKRSKSKAVKWNHCALPIDPRTGAAHANGEWSTESKKAKGLRTLCKTEVRKRQFAHGERRDVTDGGIRSRSLAEGMAPGCSAVLITMIFIRFPRLSTIRYLNCSSGGPFIVEDKMLSPSSSNLMPQMVSPYASGLRVNSVESSWLSPLASPGRFRRAIVPGQTRGFSPSS
ncbi:hypothetical protein CCUS01_13693 [Colletotrichum cuscutae]|uniref:Uncharacterized protein n=1 Tax=Colletotrichum cuscutae TaxID=1209917 RepID=A0AAI9YB78_9PEZI|nr:hypothetical protein CCUS01_13693 [Colletotrichum cuscutae]